MPIGCPPESCKVYTPEPLAKAMVLALGDRPGDKWLEPCVGGGAFLRVLADVGVEPDRIMAIDLDSDPGPADSLAETHRGTDFLAWSQQTDCRFDRVIGNPPYVALKKLPPSLRDVAMSVPGPKDKPIGINSNYWYAFFCASLRLLHQGGGLCLVLPAAWDFATYAADLRNVLYRSFSRIEIHRTQRPIFDKVQDGCIIVIGDGFGTANGTRARFEHPTVAELVITLQNHERRAKPRTSCKRPVSSVLAGDVRVGDILEVRLGGVTGDANFFLLTETERREKVLPIACLRPVLSKARHLVSAEIDKETWSALSNANERVWLFHPRDRFLDNPAVRRYLELDAMHGGCRRERYKVKSRDPWYRTPLPHRVDGFISGMSRFGPWVSLNNMTRLTATNTLYTVQFRQPLTIDQKAAWALTFLTSHTQQAIKSSGRIYADGLVKYEPGDLLSLPLLVPRKFQEARRLYSVAIRLLLKGDSTAARRIADNFIVSH